MLAPLKKDLNEISKKFDIEKAEREQGEKEIIRNINDNVYELQEKLNRENTERNTKIKIMKEKFEVELEKRDKILADYQNNNIDDLKVLKDEIYAEMDNRFAHQNAIIDNISNFLKTFQDTLKIMGKEA
jgi:hypothetical protein